jgi:hypothetical protein
LLAAHPFDMDVDFDVVFGSDIMCDVRILLLVTSKG